MLGIREEDARLWMKETGADEAPEEFAVWPCNVDAVNLFQSLADCWVHPPLGGDPVRIDRSEMLATLRLHGIDEERWPALFRQMQLMQAAAKDEWAGR